MIFEAFLTFAVDAGLSASQILLQGSSLGGGLHAPQVLGGVISFSLTLFDMLRWLLAMPHKAHFILIAPDAPVHLLNETPPKARVSRGLVVHFHHPATSHGLVPHLRLESPVCVTTTSQDCWAWGALSEAALNNPPRSVGELF